VIRRNSGPVVVAAVLVGLFLLALVVARAQGQLSLLALDLTEHLFGIVLAVFVFERLLAWREERRWLAAKDWLYMFLLETIDDLLKRLLPVTVAREGAEAGGEIPVYEAAGGSPSTPWSGPGCPRHRRGSLRRDPARRRRAS
jgi:hypothetical protein